MAQRRNVYKGGAKARDFDLFGSDLRFEWISPQLARATAISDKTLRSEYSRLRSIANKRLQRMAGNPEAAGTYERLPDQFPKLKGMSRADVVRALGDVSEFLTAKRGSLSGIRESNKRIQKKLNERGINVPKDQIAKFGTFMNAMKKALSISRGEYGSAQIAELWNELFQKGKISQSKFEKRVKEVMKDIENQQKELFTRAQRMDVNSVLRDNPVNKYFDDLALDPRTIRAAERRDEGRESLQASRRARSARARRRR